jgi:8-oxo-dGTP pyrophosphatase MutT (NUDIX family)
VVAPSNGFSGYQATFPKGRVEKSLGRQANAIREVFEESGLQVAITAFLADSVRSLTDTRY